MKKPGYVTVRELESDKKELEQMLAGQRKLLANAQSAILRLEGALTYVTRAIEKKKKEVNKDAATSGEPNTREQSGSN